MARFSGNGDGPLDPETATLRLFIDGYGGGRIRVNGEPHEGSLIVLPDRVLAWAVTDFSEIDVASLAPLLDAPGDTDLLLLGVGERSQLVPRTLRDACREVGIAVEPMDTGAAARTYNVLLAEDRRVAAALIAV